MATHHLAADTSSVKWGAHILDSLVAPECSTVSECRAPDVPDLPDYFGSFFLNNVFQFDFPDAARPLIIVFLRRLAQSVREYRAGRERLSEYVAELPKTNNVTELYLSSLAHFEQSIVSAHLALLANDAVAKKIDPNASKSFTKGDGSPAQRLNSLYNSLKHYEKMLSGSINQVAPVWVVNDGLKGIYNGQIVQLQFEELVGILKDFEANAKFISEEVYQLAAERRKQGG